MPCPPTGVTLMSILTIVSPRFFEFCLNGFLICFLPEYAVIERFFQLCFIFNELAQLPTGDCLSACLEILRVLPHALWVFGVDDVIEHEPLHQLLAIWLASRGGFALERLGLMHGASFFLVEKSAFSIWLSFPQQFWAQ